MELSIICRSKHKTAKNKTFCILEFYIKFNAVMFFFAGEGYQQLLRVMQSMEAQRTKQSGLVERLQERLSRAQEEISSLQSSMAQRTSHYQNLHTELLDKVNQATDTEKEVTCLEQT